MDQMCQIFVQTISLKTKLSQGWNQFQKKYIVNVSFCSFFYICKSREAKTPTWLRPPQTRKYTTRYLKITYLLHSSHTTWLCLSSIPRVDERETLKNFTLPSYRHTHRASPVQLLPVCCGTPGVLAVACAQPIVRNARANSTMVVNRWF